MRKTISLILLGLMCSVGSVWAETYSVTYYGNGNTSGNVPTDNTAYAADASVKVLDNTGALVKTGDTFAGWNTVDDGTGTYYCPNASFSISANTSLYAQWVTAADLTANTLYSVPAIAPLAAGTLNSTGGYFSGISANGIFTTIGDVSKTDQSGGAPEMKTISKVTIDNTDFTAAIYLKRSANLSDKIPTSHAIKFVIPEAGSLDLYVKRSDRLKLIKSGASDPVSVGSSSSNIKESINVTAGTYYLYATNSSTALYAMKLVVLADVAAPTSLECSAQAASSLTFVWTAAANASQYTATLYSDAGCTSEVTHSTVSTNTVTFSTLSAATTYYCKVQSVGDGITYKTIGGVTDAVSGTTSSKAYTVSAVTSTGNDTYGTVSAEAGSLDGGETTTITASPAAGYKVTNWAVSGTGATIDPSGASNSTTTTLTMGTANATVTVTFGVATQYSVTHSLTNVTTSSGAIGGNAATEFTDYTATFAANSGYNLPNTIFVTAGETDITSNCTWTQSTGTVVIPGSYITGNINIIVVGVVPPTYYIISSRCNVPLSPGMSSSSYQIIKSNGSSVSATTDISNNLNSTTSLYYNSTSVSYDDLTSTSNYGTSSTSNRTMQAQKIVDNGTMTITLNSKIVSKIDVIYRCTSSDAHKLTIDGTEYNTSDKNIRRASIAKIFATSIAINADGEYQVFVILTLCDGIVALNNVDATYGYATFCAPKQFTVSNATAYKANLSGETLTLTSLGNAIIPANSGVILVGNSGEKATISFTSNDATADMTGNSLLGTTSRKTTTSLLDGSGYNTVMVLNNQNNTFVRYESESVIYVPANKAYLLYNYTPSSAPAINMVFDEENNATNIQNVESNDNAIKFIENGQLLIKKEGVVYDALGRKIR